MRSAVGVRVRTVAMGLAFSAAFVACSDDTDRSAVGDPPTSGAVSERCLVRLHGKGGDGGATEVVDGVSVISPSGNDEAWGGRQWLYFPDDEYQTARDEVEQAIAGCQQVIVNGFSNGGAFAGALYCRGETFDGRLVRVVIDDPVPDAAVEGCAPDPSVGVTLYWTGGLEAEAQPGWDCGEADWTCDGGRTIGIEAYAAALGTEVTPSPFDDHQWYTDAPELTTWP
jgi:pimeloyl-ACP methyl ester carboxylesterase